MFYSVLGNNISESHAYSNTEKNKIHGDLGITYDVDVLRLHEEFQKRGLYVGSVVQMGKVSNLAYPALTPRRLSW